MRSSAEIEKEMEKLRADLTITIAELVDQTSPKANVERAKVAVREKAQDLQVTAAEKAALWQDLAKEKTAAWQELAKEKAQVWQETAKEKLGDFPQTAKEKLAEFPTVAKEKISELPAVAKEKFRDFPQTTKEQSTLRKTQVLDLVDRAKSGDPQARKIVAGVAAGSLVVGGFLLRRFLR